MYSFLSCNPSDPKPTYPKLSGFVQGSGVELVTEEELIYKAAQDASKDMSLVLSTMFTSGYGITFDTTKTSTDKDWTDNQQITWNVKITFDDNS